MADHGLMCNVTVRVVVRAPASVSVTEILKSPGSVGVPVISPEDKRVKPRGNGAETAEGAHEYGFSPPEASNWKL